MGIRAIAFILVVTGLAGFLLPFWIGVFGDLEEVELPLSTIDDIAISEDGELFFAISFLARVQQYSSDGKFLRGFDVSTAGGMFCLALTNEQLEAHIARRNAYDTFNLKGKPIRENSPADYVSMRNICQLDPQIELANYGLTSVSIKLKEETAPIIINRKLWHYLVLHPFASWFMFVIGLFLFPEWRHGVFSMMRRPPPGSQGAKPGSAILIVIDAILNLILSLYILAFATVFLFILGLFPSGDHGPNIFTIALGVGVIAFSLNAIYRIWTDYNEHVRFFPGQWIEVGPIRFVALKALPIVLVIAFIYFIFFSANK